MPYRDAFPSYRRWATTPYPGGSSNLDVVGQHSGNGGGIFRQPRACGGKHDAAASWAAWRLPAHRRGPFDMAA